MKNKTKGFIIGIILVLVVLGVGGYYFYQRNDTKMEKEENKVTYYLNINTFSDSILKYDYQYVYNDASETETTITCTSDCTIIPTHFFQNENVVAIIEKDNLYLYNIDTQEKEHTKISINDIQNVSYIDYFTYNGEKYFMFVFVEDEINEIQSYLLYNIDNEILFEKENVKGSINYNLIEKGILLYADFANDKYNYYTYDITKNAFTYRFNETGSSNTVPLFSAISKNNQVYYLTGTGGSRLGSSIHHIYNEDFKLMFDGNFYSVFAINENGNIVVSDGTKWEEYTKEEEKINENTSLKTVGLLTSHYYIGTDYNNIFKMYTYEGNLVATGEKIDETLDCYYNTKSNNADNYKYISNDEKFTFYIDCSPIVGTSDKEDDYEVTYQNNKFSISYYKSQRK